MYRPGTSTLVLAAAIALAATGARAESVYTKNDREACEVLEEYEGGGRDLRCPGYEDYDVFVHEGDARVDVDFGSSNDNFETFSAFNGDGETVEWLTDSRGTPYAAVLRFFIDVDGRAAQALVVSRVGTARNPGCVVGVVDAAADQANGVARGLGAMASLFDCATDKVVMVMVPGTSPLVREFGGANGTTGASE